MSLTIRNDLSALERLQSVQKGISEAAREVARDPTDIQLIAVSKTNGPENIQPLITAGHRCFGENRVQEALGKWPQLKSDCADIELHLIGPLQSNKVKDAVGLFDVIHTIDRPKIARAIATEIDRSGRRPELFIQVNTGQEEQKAGVAVDELTDLLNLCRQQLSLPINGLMCIPPISEEPAVHFAFLRKLAGEHGLTGLSMGMSADFKTAIQFGATHIRVGTALFGARNQA